MKIKGLGLLFLLLPSDCCTWLPMATWEAVSCRVARTRDHWPTEMVQQNGHGWQSCVLCLGCSKGHEQTGEWQEGDAGAGGRDGGRFALSPPVGHSFLQHTHVRSPLQRGSRAVPAPPLQKGALETFLLPWKWATFEKQPPPLAPHPACPQTLLCMCAWSPSEIHSSTHAPMLCGASCAPKWMWADGGQPPAAPGPASTAGCAGQAPHVPCVRSPAGAPCSPPSASHWAQGAGRLASWLYFPENVWGYKELFSAFKCTVACDVL